MIQNPLNRHDRMHPISNVMLHQVIGNRDDTEGRGSEYTIGWYTLRDDAEKAAKGNYVMGSDCPIRSSEQAVVVTESGMYLVGEKVHLTYEDPREVRARALAKLTLEERQALGIKD